MSLARIQISDRKLLRRASKRFAPRQARTSSADRPTYAHQWATIVDKRPVSNLSNVHFFHSFFLTL